MTEGRVRADGLGSENIVERPGGRRRTPPWALWAHTCRAARVPTTMIRSAREEGPGTRRGETWSEALGGERAGSAGL